MADVRDIRIDRSVANIPEELTDGGERRGGVKLFNTLAEVLVFAAILGKSHGRKKPIEEARPNPIRFSIFQNTNLDSYVFLIAVNETAGYDILQDENLNDAIAIFESYAFGGLELISEWIEKSGKGLHEAILEQMSLIAIQRTSEEKEKRPRPKIIQKKSRLLR